MPKTSAHPDLHSEFADVLALPPEARQIGAVSRSAIVAKALQAVEFHENVAAYHVREAAKIKETVARLSARSER